MSRILHYIKTISITCKQFVRIYRIDITPAEIQNIIRGEIHRHSAAVAELGVGGSLNNSTSRAKPASARENNNNNNATSAAQLFTRTDVRIYIDIRFCLPRCSSTLAADKSFFQIFFAPARAGRTTDFRTAFVRSGTH